MPTISYELANEVRKAYECRTGRAIHWGTLPVALIDVVAKANTACAALTDQGFEDHCTEACATVVTALSSVFFERWDLSRVNALEILPTPSADANLARVRVGGMTELAMPLFNRLGDVSRRWEKNDEKDAMICLELAMLALFRMNLTVNNRLLDLKAWAA